MYIYYIHRHTARKICFQYTYANQFIAYNIVCIDMYATTQQYNTRKHNNTSNTTIQATQQYKQHGNTIQYKQHNSCCEVANN